MSDQTPLGELGLEPAPEEETTETVVPEPEVAPTTEVEPEVEPEVDVPEGAKNPDAVKNAIAAERKKAREAYARARDLERQLQERDEAEKPLEERISNAERLASESEARALRLEVALDKGLSQTLARRLQGSTKEELQTDADALIAEFGTRTPRAGMEGGFREEPVVPVAPEKAHNQFISGLLQQTRHGQ